MTAVGLLWAFFGTALYQTIWAILIAFVIVYIPPALRQISGSMVSIHKELEEAAAIHGASWFRSFTRITLPLLRPAIVGAFFYVFLQSQRMLSEAILLGGPGTQIAPAVIYDYYTLGQWNIVAAASMVFAVLLAIYVLVAKYVGKVSFGTR